MSSRITLFCVCGAVVAGSLASVTAQAPNALAARVQVLEDRDAIAKGATESRRRNGRASVPPHGRQRKSRREHDVAALMLCEEPFDGIPIVKLMVAVVWSGNLDDPPSIRRHIAAEPQHGSDDERSCCGADMTALTVRIRARPDSGIDTERDRQIKAGHHPDCETLVQRDQTHCCQHAHRHCDGCDKLSE